MKRKFIGLLTFIILLMSSVSVCADSAETETIEVDRMVDEADLLPDEVEEEMQKRLDKMAEKYNLDPHVILLDDYEAYILDSESSYMNPEEFATTWYQTYGYNLDEESSGIILLISMAERDWHIYIQGEARVAVNNYGFEFISDRLVNELSNDWFEDGIVQYVDDLELFFQAYDEGEPYGDDNPVKLLEDVVIIFGIAIILSFIIALIVVSVMKSQMNTARPQPAAREYVKKGSFVLTNQQDLYLYSNTTRTAKPKESSGGGGGRSSGSRGGRGGGGKF